MAPRSRTLFLAARRGSAAAASTLIAATLASCLFHEAKAPPAPRGSLFLDSDLASPEHDAPFGVVHVGPKTVDAQTHVQIVFNRPMRALLSADEAPALPEVTLAPADGGAAIPGKLRWIGAHVLDLEPNGPVPPARELVLRVPEGTRAADGATLGRDFTAVLASPRPAVVAISPAIGGEPVGPNETFDLTFNLPVDPAEARRAITLRAGPEGRETTWPFEASLPVGGAPETVRITPSRPLPPSARVVLTVAASLRGKEGTLAAGAPASFGFASFGPLELRPIDCQRIGPPPPAGAPDTRPCDPYGVRFELSNRVDERDFFDHARLDGAKVPGSPGHGTVLAMTVPGEIATGGTHTFTLRAGLTDIFGQKLAKDATLTFETAEPKDPLGYSVSTSRFVEVQPLGGRRDVFESGEGGDAARRTAIQLQRAVQVSGRGTPSFELLRAPLDESALLAALGQMRNHGPDILRPKAFDELTALPGATVETRRVTADPTKDFVERVTLDGFVTAKTERAAGLLAVRFDTGGEQDTRATAVTVTDLAITGRMSRAGSLVWITRLSTGKPVSGAAVSLRRAGPAPQETWFSAKTDAAGFVTIPKDAFPFAKEGAPNPEAVVIARSGDDWTFRRVDEEPDHWTYSMPGDRVFDGGARPLAVVLTDRGIYRPGETVHVKGFVRLVAFGATPVPKGERVTVRIGGEGDAVDQRTVTLDEYGTFTVDHTVPPGAGLGSTDVRVTMGGAPDDLAQTSFRVAEFRPAEMAVRVETPGDEVTAGPSSPPSLPFAVRAEYLFGGAVRQGKVRHSATLTAVDLASAPPGLQVGPLFPYDHPGRHARRTVGGAGSLDATGTFQGSLPIEGLFGPVDVEIEAEVEDATRQAVSHRGRALVHLTDLYVGLAHPPRLERDRPVRVEAAALDTAGHFKKAVPIRVELRALAGDEKVVCDLVSGEALAGCEIVPPGAGDFALVATAQDSHRRSVVSGMRVSVHERRPDPPVDPAGGDAATNEAYSEWWGESLIPGTDKDLYEVGDTAKITFDSPFPEAEMLLTVEREGVLRHERRTLRGREQKLEVPITADMAPNAFVALHVHQGWQKGGPTHAEAIGDEDWITAPGYRAAIVELRIDPKVRKLSLDIAAHPVNRDGTAAAPARTFGPGESIEAEITVRDHRGAPHKGQLTFWAVDEGVLMLTGYEPPDAHATFTTPRPSGVLAIESRHWLGTPTSVLHVGYGVGLGGFGSAGGGVAPGPPRTDFRPTAFFSGALPIDADGKARARFTLPDSLTRMRLMAMAVSDDDRFGGAESHITVTRPLVLRPAAPRALRTGDRAEIAAIVTAPTLGAADVTVTLDAQGLALSGPASRTIKLPASGTAEVRWPTEAKTTTTAKLTFSASGGGASDAVQVTLPVRSPALVESVAVSGSTAGTAVEQLGDLGAVRTDVGGLSLRLGRGDLGALGEGMRDLVEYPFGCTEQLTSRLVPLLPLASLAKKIHVDLPADLPREVDRAVRTIVSHQRSDGSFGYWPRDTSTRSPWLSAYALFGLDLAKRHGHPVPAGAIESAAASLGAPRGGADAPSGAALTERAFVLDVLAATGRADEAGMKALASQRASVPLFGRALLAHAMVVAGLDGKAARALLDDVATKVHMVSADAAVIEEPMDSSYDHLLPSPARATAAVLRALVAIDEKDPSIPRLARGLLHLRQRSGGWRSTHEAAWALLTLDEYGKTTAASPTGRLDAAVKLGETLLFSAPLRDDASLFAAKTIPMSELVSLGGQRLVFSRDGEGTLRYEARLRYARKDLPTTPVERGLVVERFLRPVTAGTLKAALQSPVEKSAASARPGDLVLVEVLVATPDRRDQILIEDPLPAGLEPIDPTFVTSARDLSLAGADAPHLHRELRDDRVVTFTGPLPAGLHTFRYLARATTAGTFSVPPTRAEAMYKPEINGRTGASSFTVLP